MPLTDYDFTALAIDTNVFIRNQFDFSGKRLGLLKQYKDSDVRFLVPKIFYHEMLKHYEKMCQDEQRIAKKGLKSLHKFWGLSRNFDDILEVLEDVSYAENRLESYLNDTGAEIISCDDIEVDRMVSLFADAKPPFQDSKDKKTEFPDAIALLALEGWAGVNNTLVLVVSQDEGVCAFCEESEYLEATPDLGNAYAYFLRDDTLFRRYILDHFDELQLEDKISEWLRDYVSDQVVDPEGESYFYFDLNYAEAEFASFTMSNVNEDINILEISDEEFVIEVRGVVRYNVHAGFNLYPHDEDFKLGQAIVNAEEEEAINVIVTFSKDEENNIADFEVVDMEFPPIMGSLYYGDLEIDNSNE